MTAFDAAEWAAAFEALGGSVIAESDGGMSLFVKCFGNTVERRDAALSMARNLRWRHRARRKIARWARRHCRRQPH